MERASYPTMYSVGSVPWAALALAISSGSSLRLALAISPVPLISAATPWPVPPADTSIETAGFTLAYSSAQAWARLDMVSEPMFWMVFFLAAAGAPVDSTFFLQPHRARE